MESVTDGTEIVTETFGETKPHEFIILVGDEDEHMTPCVARVVDHRSLSRYWPPVRKHGWYSDHSSRMLHYLSCGILLSMYGPLIGLVQVKFQNSNQNPFETHNMFMIMSVIAFSFSTSALLSFRLLVYKTTINMTSIYYTIISRVIFFLAVLTPLSLVLVLFVPATLIWVGYLIVCVLFVTVVMYNFMDYVSLFGSTGTATWNVIKWLVKR